MPNPLRNLPSVSQLLESEPLKKLVNTANHNVVVGGVRTFLDNMRSQISNATEDLSVPSPSDLAETIARHYDMKIGAHPDEDFDQIAAFRKFLLFVRDTIKFRHPIHPDIHWAPMSGKGQDKARAVRSARS